MRLRYVIRLADMHGDGEIELNETASAIATWQALLSDQEKISAAFDRYDKDNVSIRSPS